MDVKIRTGCFRGAILNLIVGCSIVIILAAFDSARISQLLCKWSERWGITEFSAHQAYVHPTVIQSNTLHYTGLLSLNKIQTSVFYNNSSS